MDKIRRETIRWQILLTLNNAQPIGAFELLILSVIQSEFPDCTANELRKNLDYLNERELIHIKNHRVLHHIRTITS